MIKKKRKRREREMWTVLVASSLEAELLDL